MTGKWQRITYMPATPLGADGRRVTGSREHIALSRRAAREGMVLLKNEGGILPFASGTRLAVFGKAQADYVKGGGGSGDTTVAYVRSILDGLEEKQAEGRLALFAPLSDYYREHVAQQRAGPRAGTDEGAARARRSGRAGPRVYGYGADHSLPLFRRGLGPHRRTV